jgi:hypothetical protein
MPRFEEHRATGIEAVTMQSCGVRLAHAKDSCNVAACATVSLLVHVFVLFCLK